MWRVLRQLEKARVPVRVGEVENRVELELLREGGGGLATH